MQPTTYDLQGKAALITGASRGVGAAVAVELARRGCDVACAARSTADSRRRIPGVLEDTVAQIEALGRRAIAVPTDLAVEADARRMVRTAATAFGRLDILVNNAALQFPGDLDVSRKRYDLMMEVNVRAPMVATEEAISIMRAGQGGRILNVSSLAAVWPLPDQLTYGMTKLALERLTVDAAKLTQQWNIAVNCFRIDIPIASEGFVASTPGVDRSDWEPTATPAEGIVWMLERPSDYTGRRESMYHLGRREHIMASRAPRPHEGVDGRIPNLDLLNGLAPASSSWFERELDGSA